MHKWNLMPRLNVEFDFSDILYALNNVDNTNLKNVVKLQIRSIYGTNENYIFLTNTGRTALYLLLKALKLKKGAKVGIQLFCCPAVFDAIVRAGYEPFFLEIDPRTFTLDTKELVLVKDKLDALVVVHTFGNPTDIDTIREIIGDKPIIEDCAQAVYSKYKNKIVGTLGDASFFTYGAGKNISAGGGGALIINNPKLFKMSIEELIKDIEEPSLIDNIRFAFLNYIKSFFYKRPYYGMFAFETAKKFENKIDFQNKRSFTIQQINLSNVAIIEKRYRNLTNKITKQLKNIKRLDESFKKSQIHTITIQADSNALLYLYPLMFQTQHAKMLYSKTLKENGVDFLDIYEETPEIARSKYRYRGTCKRTEDIISRTIALPTYYEINKENLGGLE